MREKIIRIGSLVGLVTVMAISAAYAQQLKEVTLTFNNRTSQAVVMYWVDFGASMERTYSTIEPGSSVSQGTYNTHIWRFRFKKDLRLIGEYTATEWSQQYVGASVWTVEAGPIWNHKDAEQKCQAIESRSVGNWTGAWWTTVTGRMSVCEFARVVHVRSQ